MNSKRLLSSRKLIIVSLLGAITVVLGMTPLGFIPLGILNATTMHIPVIIGSIVEGPIVGMFIGLIFGLSSLFRAITNPTPMSVMLINPLISVLPRILIGISTFFCYKFASCLNSYKLKKFTIIGWIVIIAFLIFLSFKIFTKGNYYYIIIISLLIIVSLYMLYMTTKNNSKNFPIIISAFVGSMTNSILVMGGIYFFYAKSYATAMNISYDKVSIAILSIIIMQSIPEAIISCIISSSVIQGLNSRKNK